MTRKNLYILLLLLPVAACKPKYEEVTPKMAPITEAVFASGTITPKDAYTLTSISDGFLQKAYVAENSPVADKQVLFRLDNRQQNTQVSIAQTNLEHAATNASESSPVLLQIKAQIDAARVKMLNDSTTLGRFQRLYETHSVSKQDVDNALTAYESSLSAYRGARDNYRATADRARQELANTREQLRNAQAGNQYYELLAVGNGKVYQVFKKEGDLVRRGDKVALIGNPDSLVVDLDVDEGSIAKVKLGQQVLVELNTEKNKTYEAYVSKIYPYFDEKAQSYKVEARFAKQMPYLIPGTQLQANIITNKKESALLIPHQFVLVNNKVLVEKGKKIDTVAITTGITSYEWVEVTGGLTASDKVVRQK
jgi:multidrug efflux pump subunit AcrA (membrane-fusion protein)